MTSQFVWTALPVAAVCITGCSSSPDNTPATDRRPASHAAGLPPGQPSSAEQKAAET